MEIYSFTIKVDLQNIPAHIKRLSGTYLGFWKGGVQAIREGTIMWADYVRTYFE